MGSGARHSSITAICAVPDHTKALMARVSRRLSPLLVGQHPETEAERHGAEAEGRGRARAAPQARKREVRRAGRVLLARHILTFLLVRIGPCVWVALPRVNRYDG